MGTKQARRRCAAPTDRRAEEHRSRALMTTKTVSSRKIRSTAAGNQTLGCPPSLAIHQLAEPLPSPRRHCCTPARSGHLSKQQTTHLPVSCVSGSCPWSNEMGHPLVSINGCSLSWTVGWLTSSVRRRSGRSPADLIDPVQLDWTAFRMVGKKHALYQSPLTHSKEGHGGRRHRPRLPHRRH